MTALTEYQRLECPGLWREGADSQRREVIVAFGDASLIFRETPSERALTHWSLPAVVRVNPGVMPAVYSPDPASGEEIEIDDETMIAAISKVHAIIARRRPRPGRLRGALLLAVAGALAAAVLFWLPGALIAHTAKVLPSATRAAIGRAILADVERLTGRPCAAPDGTAALAQLSDRLLKGGGGGIVILPEALKGAIHLPGNFVAVGRPLIEDHDTPEVIAGYVLAETVRAAAHDPLEDALRYAGLRAAVHLLTTGSPPDGAFAGYGQRLLTAPPAPVPTDALIRRFEETGVGASAYAYAVDKTGETTLGLIEADPFAKEPPPAPLMSDADWVTLQGICGG
ncbi:MAG: hypothetical protein JSR87_13285 [Proteobacteria bacterium]|nr:hypothetical protein [Pseudomonadota bacterium]MBS0572330.1 hypothetical protein [Pseudomonadota bacterium]